MNALQLVDGAVEAPRSRAPTLLDFCGARMARNPGARLRDTWMTPPQDVVDAVAGWRRSAGLSVADAARGAGVSAGAWTRFERPPAHRIERAFPTWKILSWVMAMGGPAVDLGGGA